MNITTSMAMGIPLGGKRELKSDNLDENDYITNQHIEYVIEYEHTTGCSGCGNGCGGTNRYDSFNSAVDRLRYMLERNKDYVQFINIRFYKTVKTVFDVYELKRKMEE